VLVASKEQVAVGTLPAFYAAHADALPAGVVAAVSPDVAATVTAFIGFKLFAVHEACTGLSRHGGSRACR